MHCMICYRRIHPWCAPSPYDEAFPVLCRFCFSSSCESGQPFQLHNVKTKPGFVFSGCADVAAVALVEGESVTSASSSSKRVGAEADTSRCGRIHFRPEGDRYTRKRQSPDGMCYGRSTTFDVPDIHRVFKGTGVLVVRPQTGPWCREGRRQLYSTRRWPNSR